jgi:hypothetical protein
MADYLKSTNFATKDALPSGNAGKIVKGTEIDTEFNAISDAVESKADLLNPVFSGLLTTDTLATVGGANIGGVLAASDDVQFTSTGRMLVPKGTTAERFAYPTSGSLRYNTDLGYLENYNGTVWRPVGYVVPADVSDKPNTSTGYFQVPVGTASQRPSSPLEGLIRYNSQDDIYEGYINGVWHRFSTFPQGDYTIRYLAVAGGGGSGGGGGGAGGAIDSSFTTTSGVTYTISVGAGGAVRTQGTNSSIAGIVTAIGGGAGNIYGPGGNGGSGGAGYAFGTGDARGPQTGGTGTSGQGYAGGGSGTGGSQGGGGGGASGPGGNGDGSSTVAGNGGAGLVSTITGTSVSYAGGGGGGCVPYNSSVAGTGGAGGGGNGSGYTGNTGAANTGGGAGGGGGGSPEVPTTSGTTGGSGVVIISMPTANYSGTYTGSPTISTYSTTTVLKFTASGSYTS